MSNILSEINRVREIMGVIKEQEEIITTDVGQAAEDFVASEEYPLIEGEDRETFTGKGTMIWSNAQQQGEFNGGKLNGQGKEIWTMIDEDEWIVKHQGEFKGGSLDGQGTATYPDGQKYVGEFKDGSFDGQGTMTYADGKIEKGLWGEGDYIQGTTTFTDGTEEKKFSKEEIATLSWPANISQEIQEWAKEEISFKMDVLQDGVTSTCDVECLEEKREEIIRLQEEPVSVAREEKVWYCEQFKDGAVSDVLNYEEECLTYTKLLLTQGTDETVDVNKVVTTPMGVTSCAEQKLCDDPANPGECMECEVASELPVKGCTDPDYDNYNPLATIDDGSCKFVEAYKETPEKNIKNLKSSLKKKWKKEVFAILDNIKTGDIFGFNDVYDKQESDKLYALLTMIQNLMCVNGKIARALILAQDNVYNPKKLMTIAQFQKGEGVEGLISTIEENIDLLDKRFKWFTGGIKVDKKLSPVKSQLNQARKFINAIEPYLNWGGVESKLGFKAKTTEELLLKITNKEDMIKTCANQVV